jgi:hypothetical protein
MNDEQTFWQWFAQAAMAAVIFLGGLIMRDWKTRLTKIEDAHRGLVTQVYLAEQMREQAEERRWMHQQNAESFKTLHERLDRALDK